MGPSPTLKVSVVVPAFNEVDNIEPLLAELATKLTGTYEVIIVDDGSTDGTYEKATAAQQRYPFVRVRRLPRNQGKTAALLAGAEIARGDYLCVFDADLQFTPEDINAQVAKLDEGYDLVTGRKTGHYEKKTVSAIYNWLARRLFRLEVHDINALKTFRRQVLAEISLRKDWHRYLVPLAAVRGFRVVEIPVTLRPRHAGQSKYSSPLRILVGLLDLIAVGFQLTFMRKPLLYFGTLGIIALGAGLGVGVAAVVLRLLGHGFRPLLYLVMLLVVTGLLLFAAGFLGESLAGMSDRLERIERLVRNQEPPKR